MAVCENAMLPTFNISENYKLALNLLQETRNSHSQEKALFFVLMNNKKLNPAKFEWEFFICEESHLPTTSPNSVHLYV